MGEGNTCEVCGGTEMKLVDGFYYCVECGTQDTNVQQRVVEHTLLAIGNYGLSDRRKFTVKIKQGVEMSPEWYKWHTYNFILAGLTERLVQLGAEPGFKMKVLWIWGRYMNKYLIKEEFGRTQEVHKIGDKSESEDDEPATYEGEGERDLARFSVSQMSKLLLLSILAAALNLQRSELTASRLRRLVRHRLLPLNRARALLPGGLHTGRVEGFGRVMRNQNLGSRLAFSLGPLQRRLRLGPWRTPRLERVLAALLAELGLPSALAELVRALMWRAPVPFAHRRPSRRRGPGEPSVFPEYESTVAAYLVVALKLCFGLDDRHELRLSAEVERVNNAENRRRVYLGEGEGGGGRQVRLFSYRQWMAHARFRRHALADVCAPLAHERGERARDCAVVEQCDELLPTERGAGGGGRGGEAARLGDQVTMDILGRIPLGPPAALPAAQLAACLAAPAPLAALAAAAGPLLPPRARALVTEDFTRYSVAYAYRTLTLATERGENLMVGVDAEGKSFVDRLGDDFGRKYDPGVVYVRNCENKNWARTGRPRPSHVVGAEGKAAPGPSAEPAGPDAGPDGTPDAFEEEVDGRNIFDDDFLDIDIKEEKESVLDEREDTKDDLIFDDFDDRENLNAERPGSARGEGRDGSDDDEPTPRYDPAAFDRAETIKAIMAAAYDEMKIRQPARYRVRDRKYYRKTKRDLPPGEAPPRDRPPGPAARAAREQRAAAVAEILAAYRGRLQRDALHQVALQVRAAVDRLAAPGGPGGPGDAPEPSEPSEPSGPPADRAESRNDAAEISSTDTRDVEVVENNVDKSDDESDGPAEDPVYRGDVRFDETTHDASQLYIKFTAAPDPAPLPADDLAETVSDDDVADLLDDAFARETSPDASARRKRPARKTEPRFPPLVKDPDGVRSFGCWFKHYERGFRTLEEWTQELEREVDAAFPRSFRFLLREAAAALRLAPATLYSRVMDVERALLRGRGGRGGRGAKRPPGPPRDPPAPRRKRRRTLPDRADPEHERPGDPWTDVSKENVVPASREGLGLGPLLSVAPGRRGRGRGRLLRTRDAVHRP